MEQDTKAAIQILLVEDDEVDIQSIHRAFEKMNLPVELHIARNGIEALDQLYAEGSNRSLNLIPQLIMVDINMPMMNGIEFLTQLRTTPVFDGTKILIITTSDNAKDKLDAVRLNVDGYIMKPIQARELSNFFENIGWNML